MSEKLWEKMSEKLRGFFGLTLYVSVLSQDGIDKQVDSHAHRQTGATYSAAKCHSAQLVSIKVPLNVTNYRRFSQNITAFLTTNCPQHHTPTCRYVNHIYKYFRPREESFSIHKTTNVTVGTESLVRASLLVQLFFAFS